MESCNIIRHELYRLNIEILEMRFNGKVFLVNVMILWFVGIVQLFPTEFEDSCSWQKVSVKPVQKTKIVLYCKLEFYL